MTVDVDDRESGLCTHYCPGDIYATWKSDHTGDVTRHEQHGVILGAYVYRLDQKSCVEIPGKFPCSDRVVSSIPINKVSIMLHGSQKNREYFFGNDPAADCEPGPQCAAYKFLRRTLYAAEENVTWPNTDDVLTIRNSPYDCVLTYAGLGDSETIGLCYTQLGNKCFRFKKTTFCIGESEDTGAVGLTNADGDASAPIAMCEISGAAEMERKDSLSRPTTAEIAGFVGPSACDATVVSVDNVTYTSGRLFISADIERFHALSELGHVILAVPMDECLLPMSATDAGYSSAIHAVVQTLYKTAIATYSSGIMFDASKWGTRSGSCTRHTAAADMTAVASDLARALTAQNSIKLFLRLPRSIQRVKGVDFTRLATFRAFVTPRATVDMRLPKDCQNMWAKKGSTEGLMSYMLTVLRAGVKANRLIATISLTGGITITPSEANAMNIAKTTTDLTLADAESNTMLKCEEDINTKCCSGSTTTILGRHAVVNVTYTTTSLETLKQFPELIASAFGINQFVISPVDSDFKRKLRSNAPAVLSITSAVHRLRDWRKQQAAAGLTRADTQLHPSHRVRRSVELIAADDRIEPVAKVYKDPASGSKSVFDPQYQVGLSNKVECPGLIATNGALGVFKEPYVEMFRTAYDKIYIANVHKLASCTPGEPRQYAAVSEIPPDVAVNVHTLVPTSDSAHFMVGILNNNKLVQYSPPVNKVCNTHNSGEPTHRMNVVAVDDGYVLDKPKVEAKQGVIVKPPEAFFIVSNFSYGIDYMNLNVQCINYDVTAMQPCLMAICGGDSACRKDYGKLCNSAHEIVNDARRASAFVKEGLEELAAQENKAMMYKLPEDAEFPWMDDKPQKRPGRKKRFLGLIAGVGGLAVAWHTSNRVDKLEEQVDLMKSNYLKVVDQMVEVNSRLDENIALVNTRMDDHEKQMKRNADFVNRNFAVIKDSMNRNTEMLMRDINTKFSVTTSYQMWYAQMQSVTHQMTQAAMQVRFIARGVENCLRQIASKRSGSCPSGMTVIRDHPGLAEFPTVSTALYKDRKLFIVHSLPGTVEKTVVRGIIPMPKVSTDGIPCWPDYKVWLIDGRYYEPAECHGKYCYKPKPHSKYIACLGNPAECKTVCAPCHRGVCYEKNRFTWMESTAVVSIDSPPLKPFSRPHISDGPITFEDLLKDSIPGVPELEIIKAINTSIKLVSVKDKLQNISDSLRQFEKSYDEITATRVTFGGWLSGFASDVALWTSVAVLMAWCTGLSAALAYTLFCGGGGGGGGGSLPVRAKGYRRAKML